MEDISRCCLEVALGRDEENALQAGFGQGAVASPHLARACPKASDPFGMPVSSLQSRAAGGRRQRCANYRNRRCDALRLHAATARPILTSGHRSQFDRMSLGMAARKASSGTRPRNRFNSPFRPSPSSTNARSFVPERRSFQHRSTAPFLQHRADSAPNQSRRRYGNLHASQ